MEIAKIQLATAVLRAIAKNLNSLAYDIDQIEQDAKITEPGEHRLDLLYHSGELSVRGYNVLRRGYWTKYERHLETLEQLSDLASGEIFKMHNMGVKTFSDIINLCHKYGIMFADEKKEAETDG